MFAVLLEGIRWQSLAELKLWARFAYNPAEVLMPSHPRLPQTLNLLWLTDGVISPKLTSDGTKFKCSRYSSWTEELAWTDSFLSEYIDAWRHFHPEASDGFTCWNQKKSARLFNEGAR